MYDQLVVLDVDNLAYRNWHGWKTSKIPVVFGMLKDLKALSDRIGCNDFAFCFDSPESIRKRIDPNYKSHRRDDPDVRNRVRREIVLLLKDILPDLGYQNLFFRGGHEADDLIAFLVRQEPLGIYTLVSSDRDLYQLLTDDGRITCFHPSKQEWVNAEMVRTKYHVSPKEWAYYKALIGDKSDGIKGIPYVGPRTAANYINDVRTLKLDMLIRENYELIRKNLELIRLPCGLLYDPNLLVREGKPTPEVWSVVMEKYGFPSLALGCP